MFICSYCCMMFILCICYYHQHLLGLEKSNDNRYETVWSVCKENIGNHIQHRSIIDDPPPNILVDMEHKLMYCSVPKAACSSWKTLFFELRGINVTNSVHSRAKKELTFLHQLSINRRWEVLRSFTKFMITRNPFLRILSAYRNKIQPNGTYEQLNANWKPYQWRERVGRPIIEKYYGNDVAMDMMTNKDKYNVTFSDFVRFLVDFPDLRASKDVHWMDINSLCYPCDVNYDVIVKFESMATEMQLVFEKAGLEANLPEVSKHTTNSSSIAQAVEYYKTLPPDVVTRLYNRYYYDFTVFEYDANLIYPGITDLRAPLESSASSLSTTTLTKDDNNKNIKKNKKKQKEPSIDHRKWMIRAIFIGLLDIVTSVWLP
ncbi:putative carbohydrate sulfotransferase 11 isoform X2 [Apostichopus japonicus]|uniref:Carbohydrate sulfotransferase n=1 Tax=Stichopus japonicus TaxID=307972 RepID=A0A2G8KMA3_STIJA|nr:putative carbohydrate sulfotransferase 11 isoform X2 [Apostichopus japonicus]